MDAFFFRCRWCIINSEFIRKNFEKLFNLIEGNIKIEDMVLRDIEKENEKLEDEVDRLKEELKDLENKNKLLKNIYFDRTIEEVQ